MTQRSKSRRFRRNSSLFDRRFSAVVTRSIVAVANRERHAMTRLRRLAAAAAIVALTFGAYAMGAAGAQYPSAVTKLDQTHDLLVKSRAILDSIVTRRGVGDIADAKAAIDTALSEIESAKSQNGG
jgi:hypothetical protein